MRRRYKYKYEDFTLESEMEQEKSSIHSLPWWAGLLAMACLWGLFGAVYWHDGILPTGLTVQDEVGKPDSFIAERAALDLKYLASLGPKVVGSYENEYLVVDFLKAKIESIISKAHPSQFIEYDVQVVSGSYYLAALGTGVINVYHRLQNVVVKLHGSLNNSGHSILLNAHFDSVPISPGGSDDGINVANMLEVLLKLSKEERRQLHNIIFLFNGAEENALQASHGFITQHKWANESKILINLEAAGAGGQLILFQTGPQRPWLLDYYAKVPHPFGAVTSEELFQSGALPSDTDFRVFRDFGNMNGLDFAYFKDGYRYHTEYDDFANIPLGSYQHGGDNILALTRGLGNAQEVLDDEGAEGKTVYYDIFSWFLISYSARTGTIINLLVVALSVGVLVVALLDFRPGCSKTTIKFLVFSLILIILSWVVAVGFVLGVAYGVDILNKTMSWYNNRWFVFGLYLVPLMGLSSCLVSIAGHRNLSLGVQAQLQAHLVRLIWSAVLAVLTFMGNRSSFSIMIVVLFSSGAFLVIHLFRMQLSVRAWIITYVLFLLIPLAFHITMIWHILVTLIPVAGRLGVQTNPELLIGVMGIAKSALVPISVLFILTKLLRRSALYHVTTLGLFLVFLGLLFTSLGFPYNDSRDTPRPQRHWILHTQREYFNETFALTRADSGLFMLNMDRNSPRSLEPYVEELSRAVSFEQNCAQYTLCSMPLMHIKSAKSSPQNTWIPLGPPEFPQNETLTLTLLFKHQLSTTQVKYGVQVTGPDRLFFYLTPKANAQLIETSLISEVPPAVMTFQDRPVYLVVYQLGKGDGAPLSFNFTMEVPAGHQGPTIDLGVSANYVHAKRIQTTAAFSKFLSQFQRWTTSIPWLSAYQSYVL